MARANSRQDYGVILARVFGGVLLAGAIALAAAAWVALAHAHQAPSGWAYDPECCSDLDCAPVPESAVVEATGGYSVRLAPGQHPMVRTPLAAFLAHGDSRIRVSGDEHRHACVSSSGRLLCIYVQPGGV
jgi:hypothetical protein